MEILAVFLAVVVVGYLFMDQTAGIGTTVFDMDNKLTPVQIMGYAQAAGFSGDDLVTAIAVCLGESSGNPVAQNFNPPRENSIGLWQINVLSHPEYSQESLFDPQTNANAAFAVYTAAGNSFKPWGAFTSEGYAKYLDTAEMAVYG